MDSRFTKQPKVFGSSGQKGSALCEDLELAELMYGNDDGEETTAVPFKPANTGFQAGDALKVVGNTPDGIVLANEKGLKETLPTQQTIRRLEFRISQLENMHRRMVGLFQKMQIKLIDVERSEQDSWREKSY